MLGHLNTGKTNNSPKAQYLKKYLHIKLLIVINLSIFLGPAAFGQTQTYIDEFNSVSYGNNNGNHNFSNNWTEINDDNSNSNGRVRFYQNSLLFQRLRNVGIYRNLSIPENANAIFTCDFSLNELEVGESLDIQLWNASVNTWETIASIDGNSNYSGTISYTLTANHKSANSGVRFINGGSNWNSWNDYVTIDDVKFEVTITPPNITASGNQDFCLSTGNSIAIAESVNITGPGTGTSVVYVQVSSGYVNGEDLLELTGSHSSISSSWNATEGKLTLSGNPEASYEQFESAILDVAYSNSNLSASGNRDFAITVGDANYLPSSGHYYEYVSAPNITWTDARDAAELRRYFGLKGYLATLTSAEEGTFAGTQSIGVGWIGGSDKQKEGVWRWVTGPEGLENGGLGRQFWQGKGNGNATAPDNYHFWNTGEPNNVGSGGEDYAHITHENVGPSGSWNDLPNVTSSTGVYASQGYVVEYGGFTDDPALSISASTSLTIKPIASITLDPTLGSNIQTVCVNTAITNIRYTVSDATGVSLISGSFPNGVTGSYASGVYTISGTPTESGVFTYTIATTGGCANAEQKGTIIVNNPITISSSNLEDASCRTNADGEVEIALTGGNSIHFDGTDSYIALNLNYNATNAIPEMTVAAWVKVGPNSGGGDWAILDLDRSEYFNFTIGNSDSDYHVSFNTRSPSGDIHDFNSVSIIGDDQWHFVVGVYNSTGKYIYIDGVLDNSTSSVHSGNALGSTIRRFGFIGAGSEASTFNGNKNNGRIFEGNLADVWLFESSITDPNELNALSKGIIPNGHNAKGYWRLNDINNITNLTDPSSGEQVFGIDNSNVSDLYQFTCTKDGAAFDLTGNLTFVSTDNYKLTNLGVGDYVFTAATNNECSENISFTIKNADVTPPKITTVPSDVKVCVQNELTQEAIVSDINLSDYSDECGGDLMVQYQIQDKNDDILVQYGVGSDASGFSFPLGVNTVTYKVIDSATNESEVSFTVTVNPNPKPIGIFFE